MNIVIIDDHSIVRQGLKYLIESTENMEVIAEFSNGEEAINYLQSTVETVDIIIVDLVLPEMNGIQITQQIKSTNAQMKVIILTSYLEEKYIIPAYQSGADGFLLKDIAPKNLIKNIIEVYKGVNVVSQEIKGMVSDIDELPHLKNPLSNRELEVLAAMSLGLNNREIGEKLYVSEKTVKTHISNILRKLDVYDRTQAVLYNQKYSLTMK